MREEVPPAEPVWSLREGLVRLKLRYQGDGAAPQGCSQTTGKGTSLAYPDFSFHLFQPVPPIGQKYLEAEDQWFGKISPWDTEQGREGQATSLMTKRARLAQGLVPKSRWANSSKPSRHSWSLRYINYSGTQKCQVKMFQINSTKYSGLRYQTQSGTKGKKHLKANFIIRI